MYVVFIVVIQTVNFKEGPVSSITEMAVSYNCEYLAMFTDTGLLWIGSADLEVLYFYLFVTEWMNDLVTGRWIDWLINWLNDWWIDYLIDELINQLTDWLIDQLKDWLMDKLSERLSIVDFLITHTIFNCYFKPFLSWRDNL